MILLKQQNCRAVVGSQDDTHTLYAYAHADTLTRIENTRVLSQRQELASPLLYRACLALEGCCGLCVVRQERESSTSLLVGENMIKLQLGAM